MPDSNIIAGSNVFLSRTEDPRWDPEFVSQIQDYKLLKDLESRKQVDNRIIHFSRKQRDILEIELRCTNAKNDPCWGYSAEKNRIVSACINVECPKIMDCNPNYTANDAAYWVTTEEERKLYGKPDKQPCYYIVDMVSDEEMMRYDSNPRNEGFEYPIAKNPVLEDERDKIRATQNERIDPKTGRRMRVIGHKWIITDNASYESEELVPIWGYVEEVEEKKQLTVRKNVKRIEKKQETSSVRKVYEKPKEKTVDPDFARREEFEKAVFESITGEIKLTDVEDEYIGDTSSVILLDNPAELAFVSSTFLISGIDHGIHESSGVMLALVDDYRKNTDCEHVFVSNTVLKTGCKEVNVQAWKALAGKSEIIQLLISERDYYRFEYGDDNCWTCRNIYGVTHVCVSDDDIQSMKKLQDGLYSVSLVDDGDTFMILGKNDEMLGRLGNVFADMINALKSAEKIASSPTVIKGIGIKVVDGKVDILGMGHLIFIEY